MALCLEQRFPLGRFHATRWKQGVFGDPFGEWPPSPWRLLRALANRWFQWSRETGDVDRAQLDSLLVAMASQPPSFYLPAYTNRGIPIKQYQPMGLEDQYKYKKDPVSKKQVLDHQYRSIGKTLNEDQYRAMPPDSAVYWAWPELPLSDTRLLDALLARVLYFGRAESWTQFKRVDALPVEPGTLCVLSEKRFVNAVPVLVPNPNASLNLEMVYATTEHGDIKGREIPLGACWYYTALPAPLRITAAKPSRRLYPANVTCMQFAIGGHVLPKLEYWGVVTGHFRGKVIRERVRQLTGASRYSFTKLPENVREELRLITGKDTEGKPLPDHSHAYFGILPDEDSNASRLFVWRAMPFTQEEIEALLTSAETPIFWDYATKKWTVRLVALPFSTPYPQELVGTARCWRSTTPFVPVRNRRRFRKNGKERTGETVEKIIGKLCEKVLGIAPSEVQLSSGSLWVRVHMSLQERRNRKGQDLSLPGYYLSLTFPEPIKGPLMLGDSSHFGMGVFSPDFDGR